MIWFAFFEKKKENIGSGVPGNTNLQPCVHLSLEQDSSGHTFHRGREWPPVSQNKQGVLQGLERENVQKETFKERKSRWLTLSSPCSSSILTCNCHTLISPILSIQLTPSNASLSLSYGQRKRWTSLLFEDSQSTHSLKSFP